MKETTTDHATMLIIVEVEGCAWERASPALQCAKDLI